MSGPAQILLAEDDAELSFALRDSLELAGYSVLAVADGQAALQALTPEVAVVVTDLRMPRLGGLQLMAALHEQDPELPVILMTGHGDIPMAVKALHDGAFDFLAKPFATDHLLASVARALDTRRLVQENRRLSALAEGAEAPLFIGETAVMQRLQQTIAQIAPIDVDVLLEGETGTGKSRCARHLHARSARRRRPFVSVDCAALPAPLANEILFGGRSRRGRIDEAHQGSLYLTEIDALPLEVQGRLLSVLESKEVQGAHGAARTIDIRLIAASKRDLALAVSEGRFRDDLYYRLETLRLRLPPLRERRADVALLYAVSVKQVAARMGVSVPVITPEIAAHLACHDWPGNVQELENYATRVILGIAGAETVDGLSLSEQLDRFELSVLKSALSRMQGDVTATAALLGLPRRSLYARLQRHGIVAGRFRG